VSVLRQYEGYIYVHILWRLPATALGILSLSPPKKGPEFVPGPGIYIHITVARTLARARARTHTHTHARARRHKESSKICKTSF